MSNGRLVGVLGLSLILWVACTKAADIRMPSPADSTLPTLTPVQFQGGLDTLPWKPGSRIAVSSNGIVAIGGGFGMGSNAKFTIHLFDPHRDTMISVSRFGEGPGETSYNATVMSQDSAFTVFERGQEAVLRFAGSGTFLDQYRISPDGGLMMMPVGDSIDLMSPIIGPRNNTFSHLIRRIGKEKGGRPVLAMSDSFVQSLLGSEGIGVPPYGASASRVVIGDAMTYRLAVYSADGKLEFLVHRDIPPRLRDSIEFETERRRNEALLREPEVFAGAYQRIRARLDTLWREHLPHFQQNGLQFDSARRLWVVGTVGDSTFADIFADAKFLGRLTVACRKPGKFVALNGSWLALLCTTESLEAPYRIHLYEIK